jgi:nitric oxide reductase activation protein
MLVASQAFDHRPADRKEVLIIFSDMRQSTRVLDLERPAVVRKTEALQQVAKSHLIPNLHGVKVYALGVDASGRSVNYWQTLRDFWIAYFEQAGALVEDYSILRSIPKWEE